MMDYKFVILLCVYGFLSIGTFGHAVNDRNTTCAEIAQNERHLVICRSDAPLVAFFNSAVWPLYWSYQMHK